MVHYDHDCPLEAYITNLGKYNEGELVGEWVKFPTTYEAVQEVFQRIGIGSENEFGDIYEEWFITDYDCYVNGLSDILGEYENLDELNYLATNIEAMDKYDFERFEAAVCAGDYSQNIRDFINLSQNLDKYDIYPDVNDHDDLGRFYVEEYGTMEIPDHLQNYIDYEAYGRDVALDEGGQFTDYGYVRDTGDSFIEYYDGKQDSIPHECRVMSKPESMTLETDVSISPENCVTNGRIETSRGSFLIIDMTHEQLESAGYGYHHSSEDGKYHIMGNGMRAFAIQSEDIEQAQYLKNAEMALEDDYGMIDGIINNGTKEAIPETEEKVSVREQLAEAKRECTDHKPLEEKKPAKDKSEPER